jgi:hypothetical protein
MLNIGSGATHVNSFLAAMNIPPLHPSSMKKRENEVGKKIIDVANQSCQDALDEEKQKCRTASGVSETEEVGLSVSFDGGWSTRGSGRGYNSDTGHAVLIGTESQKCVKFSVKSKRCRKCEYSEKHGNIASPHTCYRNWDGSSKAMEPAMAVDMVGEINESEHYQVTNFTMDNDSTTIARLIAAHGPIKKKCDKNHTRKCISNGLYAVNKTHKDLRRSETVEYIVKNFMYALMQNQGNPQKLKGRLAQIVPHMYGKHDKCDKWCAYAKDPDKYNNDPSQLKYKKLPFKKPLSCPKLRITLDALVTTYQAKADAVAYLGTSQANESFNNCVASKAPKARYVL